MKENINITELETSLNNIKNILEKINYNLTCINNTVNDHINSGEGIFDGNSAMIFKQKWEEVNKNIPETISTLKKQQNNLEMFINNMKEQ